jgi:hypothetical protein
MDCSVREACFSAWISIQTIDNMKKDWDLALKYLERKKKLEFSTKQEIDQNITWWLTISWEWQK